MGHLRVLLDVKNSEFEADDMAHARHWIASWVANKSQILRSVPPEPFISEAVFDKNCSNQLIRHGFIYLRHEGHPEGRRLGRAEERSSRSRRDCRCIFPSQPLDLSRSYPTSGSARRRAAAPRTDLTIVRPLARLSPRPGLHHPPAPHFWSETP